MNSCINSSAATRCSTFPEFSPDSSANLWEFQKIPAFVIMTRCSETPCWQKAAQGIAGQVWREQIVVKD